MAQESKKVEYGKCPACDVAILDMSKKGPEKRLKNYRETHFELTDGKLMRVSLCGECLQKLDEKTGKKIMARFRKNWEEEIEESAIIPEEEKDDAIDRMLARDLTRVAVKPSEYLKRNRRAKSMRRELIRQQNEEAERENIARKKISQEEMKRRKEAEREETKSRIQKVEEEAENIRKSAEFLDKKIRERSEKEKQDKEALKSAIKSIT